MLRALLAYISQRRKLELQRVLFELVPTLLIACLGYLLGYGMNTVILASVLLLTSGLVFASCYWLVRKFLINRFRKQLATSVEDLHVCATQAERDDWQAVQDTVADYLTRTKHKLKRRVLKHELKQLLNLRAYVGEQVRSKLY